MKGRFLCGGAITKQINKKGLYQLCTNVLYQDEDEQIYLAWRNFQTDNFSWIKSNDWDTRCSHIHDVGCKYHQLVKVKLSEYELIKKGFLAHIPLVGVDEMYCKDIPKEYLEVVDVSGHQINNMFYRMLKAANCPPTPKLIQCLYRAGVSFNLNWFFTGKTKIDLDKLYDMEWNAK